MKGLMFLILFTLSQTVSAACWYAGYSYPTGSVVGGLTCQADGSWR